MKATALEESIVWETPSASADGTGSTSPVCPSARFSLSRYLNPTPMTNALLRPDHRPRRQRDPVARAKARARRPTGDAARRQDLGLDPTLAQAVRGIVGWGIVAGICAAVFIRVIADFISA